ncbi:MAG: peptidase, partial [Gemmatimonadota bacterium]
TYLILETPAGEQERNDDWGDDTMHSHIELVAPEAGTYSVLVTSFMADEVGEYTLQVAVVAGS